MTNNGDFAIENGVLKEYTGPGGDVIVPEGVVEIGFAAFSRCTGLTHVTIPESVTEIGFAAFQGCAKLTCLDIPESVTKIGKYAFHGCAGLTHATIPAGVSQIGGRAFEKTPWLKSLGEFAVVNRILLQYQGEGGDVTIPEGVTKIGDWAFADRTGLTRAAIPDNITKIGFGLFFRRAEPADMTIPENVAEIGFAAFQNCAKLTRAVIPESVAEIGEQAFQDCTGLTCIVIPESVAKIEASAFKNCTGLARVAILARFQEIDKSLFASSRPTLVAPHIPISGFCPADKPGAVRGFAQLYCEGADMDPNIRAGYLKYIKGQKKRLYPAALRHEHLLQLMLLEKMVPQKDIQLLLEEADKQQNPDAKAAIQAYCQRNCKP